MLKRIVLLGCAFTNKMITFPSVPTLRNLSESEKKKNEMKKKWLLRLDNATIGFSPNSTYKDRCSILIG